MSDSDFGFDGGQSDSDFGFDGSSSSSDDEEVISALPVDEDIWLKHKSMTLVEMMTLWLQQKSSQENAVVTDTQFKRS